MRKISPCVWYNQDALEAAELYVSIFQNSKIEFITRYLENDPSPSPLPAGTPLCVRFTLCGREFSAINGGPVYRPNPAVSFFVDCESEIEMNALWDKLSSGGAVLMEAGEYPFSKRFGWLADKYGVSWQISCSGRKQKITPYLMFTEGACGRAKEAISFYSDIFNETSSPDIRLCGKEADGVNSIEGNVMFALFNLAEDSFMAADSAYPHGFTFSEGVSFIVYCNNQEEIDAFWSRLAGGGEEQSCGWLKDKFGLSWQIVPHDLEKLGDSADPVRAGRVNKALMKMTKINIQALREAFDGLLK